MLETFCTHAFVVSLFLWTSPSKQINLKRFLWFCTNVEPTKIRITFEPYVRSRNAPAAPFLEQSALRVYYYPLADTQATTKNGSPIYASLVHLCTYKSDTMGDDGCSASELRRRYHMGGDLKDDSLTAPQLRARYGIKRNTAGVYYNPIVSSACR